MASALTIVRKYFPEVTTVKDALKDVVIEVTDKDAKSKGIKDHKTCAMAVACQRIFDADGVIISIATAYIVRGYTATRYEVTQAVQREVVSYDRKGGFEPGVYTLRKVSEVHRLGERAKRKKSIIVSHDNRSIRKYHVTTNIRTSLIES
jgi:hypothetical protein